MEAARLIWLDFFFGYFSSELQIESLILYQTPSNFKAETHQTKASTSTKKKKKKQHSGFELQPKRFKNKLNTQDFLVNDPDSCV